MLDGRARVLRVSLETDKGTAVAGAVEFRAIDPELKRDANDIENENIATGLGGIANAIPGPSTGTAMLKTYLRSNGTSGLDAGILAVLQACGLVISSSSLIIATEATQKTLTIDDFVGGNQERLYAAAGNWQMTCEFGKPVEMQFDMTGKYTLVGAAAVPTAVPNVRAPIRAESMTLTLGTIGPAGALLISKLILNANNPVEPHEDLAATQGVSHYYVGTNRRLTVEIDPEAELSTSWNPAALHEAGTTGELVAVLTDGTVNVTLTIPAMQLDEVSKDRRRSSLIWTLTGVARQDSGDDDITIAYAASGA